MMNSWAVQLATLFGLGRISVAPGTLGTIAAVPLAWLMQLLPWREQLTLVLAAAIVGALICHLAATEMGQKDPSAIVLDEVLGMLLACIALPAGFVWLAMAFVLFRALDILKPWPVRPMEKLPPAGLGIVADDLMAGAICWLIVRATAQVYNLLGYNLFGG